MSVIYVDVNASADIQKKKRYANPGFNLIILSMMQMDN